MKQSRWYNQTDGGNEDSGTKDLIAKGLQTALQVGGAIKSNREASGAAEARRQRIAACGRKPLIGFGKKFRQRKDDYNKCVADAQKSSTNTGQTGGNVYQPPKESSNMTIIIVTAGVLIAGTIAYFIFKKK